MTQPIIRAALESALATYATGAGLGVAYENVPFTPTEGVTYLRAFLLPAATASDDLGRAHRRFEGVFQVSICLPLGTGPAAGEAILAALGAAYVPATPITRSGVRIFLLQPLSPAPGIREPDRWVIPCSVPYRADSY